MFSQKFSRILRVATEPCPRAAQAKTVAPRVHVGHESCTAYTVDIVGEQDLQETNCRFLEVVATGVAVQTIAARRVHADDVAGLVQEGMDWCVGPHENGMTRDARLCVAPEAAPDRFTLRLHHEFEAISAEQLGKCLLPDVGDDENLAQSVEICLRTMRTRSSTIASRSSDSSFALPRTSVGS